MRKGGKTEKKKQRPFICRLRVAISGAQIPEELEKCPTRGKTRDIMRKSGGEVTRFR